jgi:hypothetical protein
MRGMKRLLLVLLAFLSLNSARAEEYFGVRGELLFPFSGGSASAWALPQFGVQFGVEFPSANFGFRASASTLVVTYRLALDGYYVLPIQNLSSAYFGAGVGLIGAFANVAGLQGGQALAEIRGLVGYQSGVTGLGGRFFIELIPSFIPALNGGTFGLTVGLGFNFR